MDGRGPRTWVILAYGSVSAGCYIGSRGAGTQTRHIGCRHPKQLCDHCIEDQMVKQLKLQSTSVYQFPSFMWDHFFFISPPLDRWKSRDLEHLSFWPQVPKTLMNLEKSGRLPWPIFRRHKPSNVIKPTSMPLDWISSDQLWKISRERALWEESLTWYRGEGNLTEFKFKTCCDFCFCFCFVSSQDLSTPTTSNSSKNHTNFLNKDFLLWFLGFR